MSPPSRPAVDDAAASPSNVGGSVRKRTEAPPPRKYRSIAEIMRVTKPVLVMTGDDYYDDIRCEECRRGDKDEEMLICDDCDLGFHIFCLRPIAARVPVGPWSCPTCAGKTKPPFRGFPVMQKKIDDFFRIQKCSETSAEEKCGSSQDGRRRKKRSALAYKKRKRRFLAYTPSDNEAQRLEQMASLATALTSLQIEFSNELTYMSGMAPRSANQANLEKGGMQVLGREDKETLELCRIMYTRGECPPLMVVFDSIQGFTVQADGHIKDMTLIAEYNGDVDYLQNREHDDGDSMMTLLLPEDPLGNLVICPDRRGNIARFISGINNHTREGRKKKNIKCVRYNVDGESKVLLVACRDICSGERLYYDYNGYEQEYPTQHFV